MSDIISGSDPSVIESKSNFDSGRITDVKAWLASQLDAAGKDVPDFEYTPRTVAHLHNLSTLSQAKTQAAGIVAADFRQKAAEYRCQGFFSFHSLPSIHIIYIILLLNQLCFAYLLKCSC